MLGIPLGLAVFGFGEWATHKYLLHGLGRDRSSRFSFHYHDHHQAVRRNGGYDPAYEGPPWASPTQAREAIGLRARRDRARAAVSRRAVLHVDRLVLPRPLSPRSSPRAPRSGVGAAITCHGTTIITWAIRTRTSASAGRGSMSWSDTREVFVGTDRERAIHGKHVASAHARPRWGGAARTAPALVWSLAPV